MLQDSVSERLRSRERSNTLGRGVEAEEGFLIPILSEVEQHGDTQQVYEMLYTLFSAYCPYGAEDKIIDTLARMDALGEDLLSSLIAHRLHRFNLLPGLVGDYVRRGMVYLDSQPRTRQIRWERYLIKTLALKLLCMKDPHAEAIAELLREIDVLRKGVRQYTDYLLASVEILVTSDVIYPELPGLLHAMRSSIQYLLRKNGIGQEEGRAKMDIIDTMIDKIEGR